MNTTTPPRHPMERKENESMPRCRTCNNLTLEGLPPREHPSVHTYYPPKSFEIEKEAEEFENSAALGCSACDVILQAIRRYANAPGSWRSLSGSKPCEIYLAGDCNEPLRVSVRCEWTREVSLPVELFEERRHFQGDYESLYPAIGLGSAPSETLDLDFAARLASQWISRCVQQHGCNGVDEPLLPSRVLDVASGSVKLAIPARSTTGRYAALSYCWGSVGNLTTTSSNLDKRVAEIEWDEIPNLIQDVIRIVRRLEIRYLWVDALCIVQDDSADWRRESSKMGAIYAGAYLTIAANAAMDTSCRLTSPRNSDLQDYIDGQKFWCHDKEYPDDITRMRARKRIEVLAPVTADGLPHSFCVRESWCHRDILEDSNISDSPLNKRGWVLQERLFSTRILHFAASEMVWECKASLNCECEGILQASTPIRGEESLKALFERAQAMISRNRTKKFLPSWATSGRVLQHRDFFAIWTRIVGAYSARKLTVESDRLPAVSGLARHFSLGRTYLAGLWADDLPWYLCWSVMRDCVHSKTMYSGPTWSWASTPEEIFWPTWTAQARSRVQTLEASTAPMSFNEFGEVAWGKLRLRAPAGVARITNKGDDWITACGDRFHVKSDIGSGEDKSRSNQRTIYDVTDEEDVWCILLLDDAVEEGYDERRCDPRRQYRALWVMVAAQPHDRSVQRALLDPNAHKDTIICERIGYLDNLNQKRCDEFESARDWIDSADFEEKEIILI